jgi:hypothetical protein
VLEVRAGGEEDEAMTRVCPFCRKQGIPDLVALKYHFTHVCRKFTFLSVHREVKAAHKRMLERS